MSEVAPNGYAVLHLETELPQGEPGDIDTVLYLEPQLVKHGSYVSGQLAAEEREQNTMKVMHWSS
jgi:hypothetical protein